MSAKQILYIISCVLVISIGQLLFKKVGNSVANGGNIFSFEVFGIFAIAVCAYALATVFWIYILTMVQLNKAYSFMALSFVFVSIGSFLFFDEKIGFQFMIGLSFIVVGLLVIANA